MSSNQEVMLCRFKGRCFIPEPNDPIFIGDVIETFTNGRLDIAVPDDTRIMLLNSGKIRIDRGSIRMVEIELLEGMVAIAAVGKVAIDVTFGAIRCRIGAGTVAIHYRVPQQSSRSSSVMNRDGQVLCFSTSGGTDEVGRNAAIDFSDGRKTATRDVSDGFWSILSSSP